MHVSAEDFILNGVEFELLCSIANTPEKEKYICTLVGLASQHSVRLLIRGGPRIESLPCVISDFKRICSPDGGTKSPFAGDRVSYPADRLIGAGAAESTASGSRSS